MNRATVFLAIFMGCLTWGIVAPVLAQDDAARAQVAAANANALAALRAEILAVRITPALTVAEFIDRTESRAELDQTLQRCQQIGGPRWIDDQTVQVRLEISGTRVASALVNIAAAAFSNLSPIKAAELDQRLAEMKQRTFTGTGTSVSSRRIEGIRPVGGDAWSTISDDVRVRTLTAAREDAARSVMGSIRPVELSPGQTVGDVFANPAAEQRVSAWLVSRPITRLRYNEDLEVELTLATPPQQVMDTVLDAAAAVPTVQVRADDQSRETLRNEFARRVSDASGRAKVGASPAPASRVGITLPSQPPAWIWQPLDVEAIAPASNSNRLRTKSDAETRGSESLRAKVGALRIDSATTLDDLARQDPRLSDAINRTLLRARVYKVEYRADGSVLVRMMIDARELWQELRLAAE